MSVRRTLLLFLVSIFSLTAGARAADPTPRKPNIIVFLFDDIGYGDLGCYGATKVKTPNLDRLASQGVRFTDAYAPSAVCTPTRFAMITGMYAWRHPPGSKILPGDAALTIPTDRPTIASLLKQAGYTTGVVGKWHLGLGEGKTDFNGDIKPGPREIGFDYSFLIPATVDRVPCVYVENQRVVGLDPADPIHVSYSEKIGTEPTGKGDPELLTMKLSHGHDATIVNGISRIGWMTGGKAARWHDETIADTLAEKGSAFIEKNKDKPFFLYFATHDIHVPRVPHPRFRGTSQCGTRGDVIQEADDTAAHILATLDRLKLADDTLIIFSSDNGGVLDDGYADGAERDLNGHSPNGALKGYKGSLFEGGTRVPFIARWPGHIKPGQTSSEVVSLVDMLATACAVAGQTLPPDAGPDSFNMLPALLGEGKGRDHLILHNGVLGLAIRKGNFKLIPPRPNAKPGPNAKANGVGAGGGYGSGPIAVPQIFDLANDLGETKNLSPEKPELVKELSDQLEKAKAAGRTR